jgi:hypothetical protein
MRRLFYPYIQLLFSETPRFYQNGLANTADEIGGKSIAVWSQYMSGIMNVVGLLGAFYDIPGRKGQMLLSRTVPNTGLCYVFQRGHGYDTLGMKILL